MHITISRTEIERIVSAVDAAADPKSSKPIFAHMLLTAERDGETQTLTAFASSGLQSLTGSIRAEIAIEGSAVVKSAALVKYIKQMRDGPISLATQGDTLQIAGAGRRFSMPILDAAEFPPSILVPEGTPRVLVDAQKFSNAIGRVLHSASNDVSRQHVCSVLIEWHGKTLVTVASNGHTLSHNTFEVANENDVTMLLPADACRKLQGFLGDGEAEIAVFGNLIQVEHGDFAFGSQLLEHDRFPAWRLIANNSGVGERQKIALIVSALVDSVKAAKSVTDAAVHLRGDGKSIHLTSTDAETHAEYTDEIDIGSEFAPFPVVNLLGKYLTEALTATGRERVELGFSSDPLDAVTVEGDGCKTLIMPMR
jgi:DNA polymerase-3 subunit beta